MKSMKTIEDWLASVLGVILGSVILLGCIAFVAAILFGPAVILIAAVKWLWS